MSFTNLKRRKTNFDELQKKFENKKGKSFDDDRLYYPNRDDQGNAAAELRFLPQGDSVDSNPIAKYYIHKFKGVGGWFWHKCRTTLGEEGCPVCDANRSLIDPYGKWESTPDSVKQVVRARKRNLVYVTNVYVVKDKQTPENEGKVFLFQFGAKIMDKIKQAINPEFEDEAQFDPFNPWEGANFLLKIRKVEGQTNYDKSGWTQPGPLFASDDEIEALSKKVISLAEFEDPTTFADFDVQEKALARALGKTVAKPANAAPVEEAPAVGKSARADAPQATEENSELEKLFSSGESELDEEDIPF